MSMKPNQIPRASSANQGKKHDRKPLKLPAAMPRRRMPGKLTTVIHCYPGVNFVLVYFSL